MENNDDDYFDNENVSPIKSLLGLATFSTILPIHVYTSIENMTKMTWLWPLVHLFIGILASAIGFLCLNYLKFNSFLTAAIVYGFILIITGFNHIDGVMDMGDGVMVHGDSQKKLSVMKDSMVGAGGISTVLLLGILTVAALTNILDYNLVKAIIIGEMTAKTSLITTCLLSKPLPVGIGKYFINSINKINFIASIVIVAVISYLLLGYLGLSGVLGAIVGGILISIIAKRNFDFANGDVLGCSNEFGRLMSLIFMIIFYVIV